MRISLATGFIASTLIPRMAVAHPGEPLEPHDLWTTQAWILDPFTTIPIAIAAALYWRGDRKGHGLREWEVLCYWSGWLALTIALVSPIHAMGEALFSAHMVQHEILMVVAAPLLVLGRPLVPYLWGLPGGWRRHVARPFTARPIQRVWHWSTQPFNAWWLHGAALWVWHVPAVFEETVRSEFVHALQHCSFLFSALLFWWALLRARHPMEPNNYGTAALYVFGTAVHSSILGALLTFAPTTWYPVYAETTYAWGLTALEDQQLGGLIMWVPGGALYAAAGVLLIGAWLRESESNDSHTPASQYDLR